MKKKEKNGKKKIIYINAKMQYLKLVYNNI